MLGTLVSRPTMIEALADHYGVDTRFFRVMDQPVIEQAYLYAIFRWGPEPALAPKQHAA